MNPKIKEALDRALEEIESMSSEEFQISLRGFTTASYNEYLKNSFHSDWQLLLNEVKSKGSYHPESHHYDNTNALVFINEKLFNEAFDEYGNNINDNDDYSESNIVLNGILKNTIYGQGSITSYTEYVQNQHNGKITKVLNDPAVNDITYLLGDMSVNMDNITANVKITDGKKNICISKVNAINLRDLLNSLSLGDEDE